MKFWASLLLLIPAGCAVRSPAVEPGGRPGRTDSQEGRAFVERLRVDTGWRPPSTGGEGLSCSYELPEGAYVAQGWPWYCYRPCEWDRPIRWSRNCRQTVTESAPRFR